MALFRNSQTYDARVNTILDMPDMQWHGTMLYDKKTFNPISGYDQPKLPLSTDIVGKPTHAIVAGNIAADTCAIIHNFDLGQSAYMISNSFAFQNIPDTNIVNDIPKAYEIDPEDPDMIYFIHDDSNIISQRRFVKFNIQTQEVVWSTKLQPLSYYNQGTTFDKGRCNVKIWKIKNGIIYLLLDGFTRMAEAATVSYTSYGRGIVGISAENGVVVKNPIITRLFSTANPTLLGTEQNSINGYGLITGGCGNSLIPIEDINENETLFFSSMLDINTDTASTATATNTSPTNGRWRAGFVVYNTATHSFNTPEDTIINPAAWNNKTLNNTSSDQWGLEFHFPKASAKDKTIIDKLVVYSVWGTLLKTYANVTVDDSTFWQIYKFEYDPQTESQKAIPMVVLNENNQLFTKNDWQINFTPNNPTNYTKPYIIYSEHGKKYLMIYVNQNTMSQRLTDNNSITMLFEFLNDTTLKLVDKLPLAIQDLFWLKDNEFIGLNPNRIRFFRIDTNLGKFINFRTLTPEKIQNKFIWAGMDDISNFWYAEAIANDTTPTNFNNISFKYINSLTINKLEISKEFNEYDYNDQEIDTWIEIKAISDFNEVVERDVEIKIIGPAKFTENSAKTITLKTNNGTAKRVPITITGTGEALFNAYLIKSTETE